jgi:hypothetical protein
VDNIATPANPVARRFSAQDTKTSFHFRVNPQANWPYLPMTRRSVIAKIVIPPTTATQHPSARSCPRILWAALWITMFTTRPGRASTGFAWGAR